MLTFADVRLSTLWERRHGPFVVKACGDVLDLKNLFGDLLVACAKSDNSSCP